MPLEYCLAAKLEGYGGTCSFMTQKLKGLTEAKVDDNLQENPNDPKAYIIKSYVMLQTRDPNAIAFTESAIDKFPESEVLYHALGMLQAQNGDNKLALEAYKKAFELNPISLESAISVGTMLNRLERYEEAKSFFYRAIELNPEHVGCWVSLAKSELETGELEKALQHMSAAVYCAEFSGEKNHEIACLSNRMELYDKLGNISELLDDFERVYNLDPRKASHTISGIITSRLGSDDLLVVKELTEGFETRIPGFGGDYNFYSVLGIVYAKLGEQDKIEGLAKRAMRFGMNPSSLYGLINQVLGYNVLGESSKSQKKTKEKGTTVKTDKKIGRNALCPCDSGKKFKKCCGNH
ncbi:hypothetical protein HN695_05480 [Candidatus Woesearchaeota archaeon]|nr:hypothetical protein [Candidatus Woesearchaeota archaeon]MBT7927765.1 hypothetical protein [Candidatus Woesearchaeota archaeon]